MIRMDEDLSSSDDDDDNNDDGGPKQPISSQVTWLHKQTQLVERLLMVDRNHFIQ